MSPKNLVCLLVLVLIANSVAEEVYKDWVTAKLSQLKNKLCTVARGNLRLEFPVSVYRISDESVNLETADTPIPEGSDLAIHFVCIYKAEAQTIQMDSPHDDKLINKKFKGSIKIRPRGITDAKKYTFKHPGVEFAAPGTALRDVLEAHIEASPHKNVKLVAAAEFETEVHAQYETLGKYYYEDFSILFNDDLHVAPILN